MNRTYLPIIGRTARLDGVVVAVALLASSCATKPPSASSPGPHRVPVPSSGHWVRVADSPVVYAPRGAGSAPEGHRKPIPFAVVDRPTGTRFNLPPSNDPRFTEMRDEALALCDTTPIEDVRTESRERSVNEVKAALRRANRKTYGSTFSQMLGYPGYFAGQVVFPALGGFGGYGAR